MTTGQSLIERAAQADAEQRQAMRDSASSEREQSLTKLIDRWEAKYSGPGDALGLPLPARGEFSFAKVRKDSSRYSEVQGWAFESDGVSFLYSTSSGDTGLHVVVACPDCGVDRAEHVSSLEQLGRLLRVGHGFGHRCREIEARSVAYAIESASRALGLPPAEIVAEALGRLGGRGR